MSSLLLSDSVQWWHYHNTFRYKSD